MGLIRRGSGLLLEEHAGQLHVRRLDLRQAHLTDFGRKWLKGREWLPNPYGIGIPGMAGGASGLSQYAASHVVNHLTTQAAWTPSGSFLALCTAAPASTNTGSTISEATYTGYARVTLAANWTAATVATPSVGVNTAGITFAYSSGTSTLLGFAICDQLAAGGNMIFFGTLASTVISATQQQPTVGAGVLQVSANNT